MATDPDMTAAELALGVLDGEDRAAALRRTLAEPDFAREVAAWRDRLSGLFEDYAEIPAPAFESICERVGKPPRVRSRWPALAAAVAGVAAVLLLLLVTRPAPVPHEAPHRLMIASLTLSDKSASVPALVDATTGEVRASGAELAPAGKSAELWMIGSDGVPEAMGLLDGKGPSRLQLSPDRRARLAAGMTLAISIEPIGGSPTGKPTGPVVASGPLLLS